MTDEDKIEAELTYERKIERGVLILLQELCNRPELSAETRRDIIYAALRVYAAGMVVRQCEVFLNMDADSLQGVISSVGYDTLEYAEEKREHLKNLCQAFLGAEVP